MSIFFKKKEQNEKEKISIQEERKHLLTQESEFFLREAYKTLRTNVSFALEGEDKCRVVVVTSSHQGEGKSITTANLAIAYTMTDRKVLLIDCDLRRPKLARLLQLSAPVGLSNLIIDSKLKEKAIIHTKTPGLDVILSGDVPPNPSELLGSVRMQHLLDELREDYDYIFLDSPPVNIVTDAVTLAPESDGVLFLVRANQTERGAVAHAVNQLKYSKSKILGFVFNGVEMEKTHYYGKRKYRGYGYGYGYGYESSGKKADQTQEKSESASDKG